MSLDYRLPEGMTNGDLPNDGNDHFTFCILMMSVGVPTLTGDDYEKFRKRIVEYGIAEGWDNDQRANVLTYAETVKGMTTNVSPKTDAQWRKTLHSLVSDRAGRILSIYDTDHKTSNA